MNDDQRRNVMICMDAALAARSLDAANALGLSRSAWLRQLIRAALGTGEKDHG